MFLMLLLFESASIVFKTLSIQYVRLLHHLFCTFYGMESL
jgi:hypothetical protein